jgi:hypothetical protein
MVFYPNITLSAAEQNTLAGWIASNLGAGCFADANMGGNRVTTRYTAPSTFEFPDVAHAIRKRLSDALGFALEPAPGFKDGMVASCASAGDTCYAHKDPRWHKELFTVHCNVIVSAPESGGELFVEARQHEMQQGQFICYPVSEVEHQTLAVNGKAPRLMWVFGFCVSPQQYIDTARKHQ